MTIFISGGCKSGKSTHAERIAKKLSDADKPLYYIATMIPTDDEDSERIERHRENRSGKGFKTVELPRNIGRITQICDMSGTILLDSLTALLANEMFKNDMYISKAGEKIIPDLCRCLKAAANMVIVSDFICSDAFFYDKYTENFIKSLALLDRHCASHCDVVLEAFCGTLYSYKGEPL